MNKHAHIVCFDAPSPADYGGAIDLHCKIRALAESGMELTLHYFNYREGRGHEGLEPYCRQIYTYSRKRFAQCLASPLPFIVASRVNKELAERLNQDKDPVILEGIHCTGMLPFLAKDRQVLIRLHNNEAAYYRTLALHEQKPLRNLYYTMEANRLDRYQMRLPHLLPTAALAQTDEQYFSRQYGWEKVVFVPAFVPWQQAQFRSYAEPYCLYHGNLSVSENEAAVRWLMRHVFNDGAVHLVVAGKAPAATLRRDLEQHPHCTLAADPADEYLEQLIGKAQINILPALNNTGVKLKLLHALFRGRHCIANGAAVAGSGLEHAVHLAEDAGIIKQMVAELMNKPFGPKEIQQRSLLLQPYDNRKNAAVITSLLFPPS